MNNFNEINSAQVKNIQDKFNIRPRKVLGYLFPIDIY